MARNVQDPEHKALRILDALLTWALVERSFAATASHPAYFEGAAEYPIF
jgi:hypothetical protein